MAQSTDCKANNLSRNLTRFFEVEANRVPSVPLAYEVSLPMYRKPARPQQGVQHMPHHLMLPHEYLGFLHRHNRQDPTSQISPSPEARFAILLCRCTARPTPEHQHVKFREIS